MSAQAKARNVEVVKLRLKIGAHEFRAKGPPDVVNGHLETWKVLAGLGPPAMPIPAPAASGPAEAADDPVLPQLFTVDAERKLVTLRISPETIRRHGDVALLLLYGYSRLLNTDGGGEVSPQRLEAALIQSGRRVQRVDRALARHLASGWVRKGGRHKHAVYALTPAGERSAGAWARQLAGR